MNFKGIKIILFIFCIGVLSPCMLFAATDDEPVQGFRETDLPLPRYVSLRSDKVYARAGPALRYPIKWIYKREGLPVEITQEFENWRKIKDFDGEEGWIHHSLLSGERMVVIKEAPDLIPMRGRADDSSRMVARLEPHVIAHVEKCTSEWCHIIAGGYRGWVKRNLLWGIYEDENLN